MNLKALVPYFEFLIGAFLCFHFHNNLKKEIAKYSYVIFRTCFYLLLLSVIYEFFKETWTFFCFQNIITAIFAFCNLLNDLQPILIFISINCSIILSYHFKNEETLNIITLINALFIIMIIHLGQIIRNIKSKRKAHFHSRHYKQHQFNNYCCRQFRKCSIL